MHGIGSDRIQPAVVAEVVGASLSPPLFYLDLSVYVGLVPIRVPFLGRRACYC